MANSFSFPRSPKSNTEKIILGLIIILLLLVFSLAFKQSRKIVTLEEQINIKINEIIDASEELSILSDSLVGKNDAVLNLVAYNNRLTDLYYKVQKGEINGKVAQFELNQITKRLEDIMSKYKIKPSANSSKYKTGPPPDPNVLKIKELTKSIDDKNNIISEKDKRIEILEKQNKALLVDNESLRKEISNLEVQLDDKKRKIKELNEKIDNSFSKKDREDLENQLKELRKDTSNLNHSILAHANSMVEKEQRYNEISQELDLAKKENKTQIENYGKLIQDLKAKENIQIYAIDNKGRKAVFYDQEGKEGLDKNVVFANLNSFFIEIKKIDELTPAKIENWELAIEANGKNNKSKVATISLIKKAGNPMMEGKQEILKEKLKEMRKGNRTKFDFFISHKGETILTNVFEM